MKCRTGCRPTPAYRVGPIARTLEDEIVAALTGALHDGRLDVADHLLRALETLASDCAPGSSLAEAHLLVAQPQGC